jgi:hypothetical protein
MEAYATLKDTIAALSSLGFIHFEVDGQHYMDSSREDAWGGPVAQLYLYKCGYGYYCVEVNAVEVSGFSAPVVWSGPRAAWDQSNPLDEFVKWLDKYVPGWR